MDPIYLMSPDDRNRKIVQRFECGWVSGNQIFTDQEKLIDKLTKLFVRRIHCFSINEFYLNREISLERDSFMKMNGHKVLRDLMGDKRAPEKIVSKVAKILAALQDYYSDTPESLGFQSYGINKLLSDYYEQHPEEQRPMSIFIKL